MKKQKIFRAGLITAAVIVTPFLLERLPQNGWKIFLQIAGAIILSLVLAIDMKNFRSLFRGFVKRLSRAADERFMTDRGIEELLSMEGPETETSDLHKPEPEKEEGKGISETDAWKEVALGLFRTAALWWLWLGPFYSVMLIVGPPFPDRLLLHFCGSVLLAVGIAYLSGLFIWLRFFHPDRTREDYFKIRPREKGVVVYGLMAALALILAFILKRAFEYPMWLLFLRIAGLFVGIVIISPIIDYVRKKALSKVEAIEDPDEFFGEDTARRIKEYCDNYGINMPEMYQLKDDNPAAPISFGYGPIRSWLYVSRGLKKALYPREFESIIIKTLAHLKNWDFLAVTAPAIILGSLLESFLGLRQMMSQNLEIPPFLWIYLLSIVSINLAVFGLSQFLSRIRHYYADECAARFTELPDALSRAIAKIEYGLAGPNDRAEISTQNVEKAMEWDLRTPWARITEFFDGVPLAANRIRFLAVLGGDVKGRSEFYEKDLKMHRYGEFILDVAADWGYLISLISSVYMVFNKRPDSPWSFITYGVILAAATVYRYPLFKTEFKKKKIRDLVEDLNASPVRGTPVEIEGRVVGRGNPGSKVSSSPVIEDDTGIIFCDYQIFREDVFGFLMPTKVLKILNPFSLWHKAMGLTKTEDWIDKEHTKVRGWFRRKSGELYVEVLNIAFPDGRKEDSWTSQIILTWAFIVILFGAYRLITG